jgi:hypothetical protein
LGALEASYHLLNDMQPLVNDQAPAVRENAMVAMGRLGRLSDKLHEQIAGEDTIDASIKTIAAGTTPSLLKAALFLLHSSVSSSVEIAQLAVERNALPSLCERVDDADSGIKAAAVWCLAAIANHEQPLASSVADSGALPLLMQCLKEPSLPLRRIALSCLGCIAKHEHALADLVHKEGAITTALEFLTHKDFPLRRQACRLLACAIQHHDGSVEWVPSASRTHLMQTIRDGDGETAAFAAAVADQLAKRSASAATQLVELGIVPVLVSHIAAGKASPAAAAAALGHICDANADAAVDAVNAGALSP